MKIEKNWFYRFDEKTSWSIEIMEWVYAFVFLKDIDKSFEFALKTRARLDLFGFFKSKTSEKVVINQEWENTELKLKFMYFNSKNDLTTNIKSKIKASNSKSNLNIIWIVKDNKLSIDSSIEIVEWVHQVEANLKQKNLFIWDSGQVRWLPKLLVRSNEVKASHSCKVEKIDENLLFYLKSRGISESKAILLMIESYFIKNFKCLNMVDEKSYNKLFNDFLTLSK